MQTHRLKDNNELDFEKREKALRLLNQVKERERAMKTVPLYIRDEEKTVFMVSAKMNAKQMELLKCKKLNQLKKKRMVLENEVH